MPIDYEAAYNEGMAEAARQHNHRQLPMKEETMATQTFTAKPGTAGAEFLKDLADKCNTLKASTPASGWEGGLEKILASTMPYSKGKLAQVFKDLKDLEAEGVIPEMVENTEPPYAIICAIESGDPQEVASVYYVGLFVGRGILGLDEGSTIDYEAAYNDLRAAVIEYRDALNQTLGTTNPSTQQIARRSTRIVAAETHLFRLVADAKARAYIYDELGPYPA